MALSIQCCYDYDDVVTFFLIGEMEKWEATLSPKGFWLLFLAISTYFIVALIVYFTFSRITFSKASEKKYNLLPTQLVKSVEIDGKITILIIAYELLALVKFYLDVKHSSSSVGAYSSFGEMVGNYRNASVDGTLSFGVSKISVWNLHICTALAYVYGAICIQNMLLSKKKTIRWNILNWSPVIIYVCMTLINGGRNSSIQLAVALVVYYFIKSSEISGNTKFEPKTLMKLVLLGLIALLVFSSFRSVVGRTSDDNTFDYLAEYLGAPIKNFDIFVNESHAQNVYWGQETFGHYYISTGKISTIQMSFRKINGHDLGNVYTAYRSYYSDFGISGLIILTAINSFLYSFFYLKLKMRKKLFLIK